MFVLSTNTHEVPDELEKNFTTYSTKRKNVKYLVTFGYVVYHSCQNITLFSYHYFLTEKCILFIHRKQRIK